MRGMRVRAQIQILRLNPVNKIQSKNLGWVFVVGAVRSNKEVGISSLFRHSIVAVVEEVGIFPPHFMQW